MLSRNYLGGPLMREIRVNMSTDLWSETLSWWFAIADTLYLEGGEIPTEWQYRPSPFLVPGETTPDYDGDYQSETVWDGFCNGWWDLDDLTHTGNVLSRYAEQLSLAGRSY